MAQSTVTETVTIEETMKEVVVGFDGKSQAIIVLRSSCGCEWTRNGKVRLSVCTSCLQSAHIPS